MLQKHKYNELSFVESIFYAIWHFLEEYVIYPLFGDKEEPASGDGSALVGEASADTATSEGALNTQFR